jgi:hypothetical protein
MRQGQLTTGLGCLGYMLQRRKNMLIWLVFHNSLPMISLRFARQIATSPSCSRCYLTNKDALHCLQDCRETKSIWDIIGFSTVAGFWCADVADWIVQLASLDSAHLFF